LGIFDGSGMTMSQAGERMNVSNLFSNGMLIFQLVICSIFFLVGFGLLVLAGLFAGSSIMRVLRWQRGSGMVVGHEESRGVSRRAGESAKLTFKPRVQFSAPNGRLVTFISSVGRPEKSPAVGDSVEIRFDPNNPEKADVAGFANQWLGPLFLLISGGCFVGFSLPMLQQLLASAFKTMK
jgi:hypothetical protein